MNSASEQIIQKLEGFSGKPLRYREDLKRVIDAAVNSGKITALSELAFYAKYTEGLLSIVRRKDKNVGEEQFEKIKNEFGLGMAKVKEILSDLLSAESEFIREIFDEKYLQPSRASLTTLSEFCEELSLLKILLNDLKRKDKDWEEGIKSGRI